MCGIFGYIGKIEYDKAKDCLNTLEHRGPDGYGLWQEGPVTLGHRRLAILDLSEKGKQPMSYLDDRYHITFNGEIYNFVEIKKELESKGYKFVSDSDTEVVLAAYAEWKEKCLDKFNGMWAMAIWDDKEKSLFLSRDRFGKKPLFYSRIKNNFAFASEMKAIAPLLDKIEVNENVINDYARIFYYESTENCLIKNIKRFPAGHYAYLKNNELRLHRFWHTLDHLEEVPAKYEDQVVKFRELFLDACKIRMRSDVPIGTALSGGLDSSAVISAVAHISKQSKSERLSKQWQHAFIGSFPGTPIDETKYAKIAASHIGVKPEVVNIDPSKYIDQLAEQLYKFEDYYITPPTPFSAIYGAMAKAGIKVTLDGHGADELFGGYGFDYLHIIHDTILNPKKSFEVIDTYYNSYGYFNNSKQFNNLPDKRIFYAKQLIKNLGKKILNHKNQSKDMHHPAWQKLSYFAQKLYISSHDTVLPTLLRNYDRYSMMNGVEIRMPFMDHRLVTYGLSLPWTAKIRNGYSKNIIRDATADLMNHDIAYRKEKIGLNAPMVDWCNGPLKQYFIDIIESNDFKNCGLIDYPEVKKVFEKITTDPKASFFDGEKIWRLMMPYLWKENFVKKIKN